MCVCVCVCVCVYVPVCVCVCVCASARVVEMFPCIHAVEICDCASEWFVRIHLLDLTVCGAVVDVVAGSSPQTILGHCVHMDDREIDVLKARGCGLVHCACSNTT